MAKTSTGTRKASATKAAAVVTDIKELQPASGAEGKAEGAAASTAAPEAKASEAQIGAVAADPAGTTDASAASVEQSRERAEASSTDRKGAAEEGNQPEAAAQPPVAEQIWEGPWLRVRGPEKGFRRAGFHFPHEGLLLEPKDFGSGEERNARVLAVLTDPALNCSFVHSDGTEEPIVLSGEERTELALRIASAVGEWENGEAADV